MKNASKILIVSLCMLLGLGSLLLPPNEEASAGSIPSYPAQTYFPNTTSLTLNYFVAMFSNSTSQHDDKSWDNGTPVPLGTTPTSKNDISSIFNVPYSFDYEKNVKSVDAVAFNADFLAGKSNEEQAHWIDVFNDSRPDDWLDVKAQISQTYAPVVTNLNGIGTKSVSFNLKLKKGSYLDAPAPKRAIASGGNITETHYFAILLKIEVYPTLEVKYFDTNGNSLAPVFGNSEKNMANGQPYTVTPPTNAKYVYKGYKQAASKTAKSGIPSGSIQSGIHSFTYDGNYVTKTVYLYYDTASTSSGTIHVRHMVRTGSSGTYTQAAESTIAVSSLPKTQTVTPNSVYGSVNGSSLSYSAYSDTVNASKKSQSVSLTSSQKNAYVTFFYEKPSTGFQADFDVIPSTIKYGDSFKYEPKNMDPKGCAYNYTTFRTQKDGVISDTDKTLGIFYGKSFSDSSKYPPVVSGPGEYEVYMRVNSECGDTWIGPKTLTVTADDPPPPPTPSVNNPPAANISFYDPLTENMTTYVEEGRFVDLKVMAMTDPDDGDSVHVLSWDLSDWINDSPPSGAAEEFRTNLAKNIGTHTVSVTVEDSHGATYTAKASLTIASHDPIAVISGATRVKEGRTLNPPLESKSYSPVSHAITEEHWTNKQTSYPNVGTEEVTLWVKDDQGYSSKTVSQMIDVFPDEPPVVTLDVPAEETRLGTVRIGTTAFSPDSDHIASMKLQVKYDAANNGFSDDAWTIVKTGLFDSYTFTPSKVGKYLFRAEATEDYGKIGNTDGIPETSRTLNVLNLPPSIDVIASSEQTSPPTKELLSMEDLYQTGTVTSLDAMTTADKKGWTLADGELVSKSNKSEFGVFLQNATNIEADQLRYYGDDHPTSGLYASVQNKPQLQSWFDYDMYDEIVTDEKQTYHYEIRTNILTAYDNKTGVQLWQVNAPAMPQGDVTNSVWMGIVDGRLIAYVGKWDSYSYYYYGYLISFNRSNGATIQGPTKVYESPNVNPQRLYLDKTGIIIPMYNAAAQKYDFNFQLMYSYSRLASNIWPYQPVVLNADGRHLFSTIFNNASVGGTGYALCSGGQLLYNADGTIRKELPFTFADHLGCTNKAMGSDDDNNIYLIDSQNYLAKMSQQGEQLNSYSTSYALSDDNINDGSTLPLGLDKAGNMVFEPYVSCNMFGGTCGGRTYEYKIAGFNMDTGQNSYEFNVDDPTYHGYYGSMMGMINGSDGLTNLFGLYRNMTTYELYIRWLVYDPFKKVIVRNDLLDTGFKNNNAYYWYWIQHVAPIDDQSFAVSVYSYDTSMTMREFRLTASGPLTYPKAFDIGPNPKELWLGSDIGSDTLTGDVKASKSADEAFGYVYRAQDNKNYYSAEFEQGKVLLKKTVNGAATTLFTKAYPTVAGQTYTIQFTPENGGFGLYVNRIKQTSIADATWMSGKFGVIDRGHGGVTFGNAYTQGAGLTTGSIAGVVLVGGSLDYNVIFDDPEHDPRVTAGESWNYTHNPNVFLHPLGTWSGSGKDQSAPVTKFDLPGEYTFRFKTKDDPQKDYLYPSSVFASYRQESNEVTGVIRVHRRPVADFTVSLNGDYTLSYDDQSYDPDRYDPATGNSSSELTGIDYAQSHGVVDRIWRYRKAGDSDYTMGQPSSLADGTYYIELSVQDEYGAWSDWDEQEITVQGAPDLPPNPGFLVYPASTYRGNPVTIESVASDPVDGGRENLIHAYYIGGTLQSDSRTEWEKVFNSLGIKTIQQVVTNSAGLSAEATQTVEIYNRAPTATVTNPPSADPGSPTLIRTLTPTFAWTYADPDSDAETQYQVQVYKSDGTKLMDSNAQSGASLSWTANSNLPEGVTMYVIVRVYDGYAWSEWSDPKYFVLKDSHKPVVNVTAPSSTAASSPTLFTVLRPGFVWTYADQDGDPETQYHVQVFRTSDNVLLLDSGTKSGAALSWTASANLPEDTTLYVQAQVYDGLLWSDWSSKKYFTIQTNRPPTGDFSWSPSPVYEDDTVTLKPVISDPDHDDLSVTFKVMAPSGAVTNFSYSWSYPYPTTGPSLLMNEKGSWSVTMTVSDDIAPAVIVTKTVVVNDLSVQGVVDHTERYEQFRIAYNLKQSGETNSPRTSNMFVAGEAFVLRANTTNTGTSDTKAVSVVVSRSPSVYSTALTSQSKINWSGKMVDENNNQTLKDGNYTFRFKATWSNGHTESVDVVIRIDDDYTLFLNTSRQETNT